MAAAKRWRLFGSRGFAMGIIQAAKEFQTEGTAQSLGETGALSACSI
jgi:hypothetical protein